MPTTVSLNAKVAGKCLVAGKFGLSLTIVPGPTKGVIPAALFGAAARDFTNLTQNGLIRITIPLPTNVKLLDCGSTVPCPASALPTSETARVIGAVADGRAERWLRPNLD